MSKISDTWLSPDNGGIDFFGLDHYLHYRLDDTLPALSGWSEDHVIPLEHFDDVVGEVQTGGGRTYRAIPNTSSIQAKWHQLQYQGYADHEVFDGSNSSDILGGTQTESNVGDEHCLTRTDAAFLDHNKSSGRDGTSCDSLSNKCLDCGLVFRKVFELEAHAKRRRHKPFECGQCLKRFSRRDACSRHISLHSTSQGKHECRLCGKYQGRRAFKRRDHLVKHLRTVHHIGDFPRWCPHINCALNNRNDQPEQFRQEKDYDRHMHECHDGKANTCSVPLCEKYGGRDMLMKDRQSATGSPVSDVASR